MIGSAAAVGMSLNSCREFHKKLRAHSPLLKRLPLAAKEIAPSDGVRSRIDAVSPSSSMGSQSQLFSIASMSEESIRWIPRASSRSGCSRSRGSRSNRWAMNN